MERKPYKKPRIGLYSIGLKTYWDQFSGLRERLESYGEHIAGRLRGMDADVFCFGLVDCEESAQQAGQYFKQNDVDLIFCHAATYCTSACVLPVHTICTAPAVVLNLQPTARIDYDRTTTGEWLAHCGACPVPEISNAFQRAGIPFRVVNGLLGLEKTPAISMTREDTAQLPQAVRAWAEIEQWVQAARVRRNLLGARFGFLGNTYSGMLDLYSDFTMLSAQTGMHLQVLEMCDLERCLREVTDEEVRNKQQEIADFFLISEDNAADPLARRPSAEQLEWSARVAAAQERLVRRFDLDAMAYYYHGAPGGYYEKIQSGFIVGHSLLTAAGVPCAGEGDLKTALAMKICDILGKGGSFCEIVVTDYLDGTILLGHDGPFHLQIARSKPILRGMGLYHGKQGSGISVEAKVKLGPITNLNCTQTLDGKLKFIITEAQSVDGQIMTIGNTQTPVRFHTDPDSYMSQWFAEAPTHHFAMSIGHNASVLQKVSDLLGIRQVTLN